MWSATTATRGDILIGSAELQEIKTTCTRKAQEGSDQAEEGPNYALMAFSSSNSDFEVSNDSTCLKSCLENVKLLKYQNDQLLKDLKKFKLMVLGYRTSLKSVEERLEFYKTNESIYLEDIKVLKVKIQIGEIAIRELRKKPEISQKEKDGIQLNVDKFKHASKSLNKLIEYEFVNKPVVENCKAKSSKEEPKVIRKNDDALIIEEWVSDNEEEDVSQPKIEKKIVMPSIAKIEPKAVINVVKENNGNAVKASAFWVWKPKHKTANLPFLKYPKSSNDDGSKPLSDDGKKFDLKMPALEDVSTFDLSRDDKDDGVVANMNNLDKTIQVSPIPTTRTHKDHPLDQVIRDLQSATQTRNMLKTLEEHGFISTIQQRTNHKDLQSCSFACFLSQEESKKTASTPMENQKPLLKDEDGKEVDVHMYRSMIGLLMYLTSSRLDIMFAVCACARHQVNPKVSHLHDVKRIFKYLKGQPKLGL
nr:putative ribonuclease H-like domain-containing protein [Tanacetum cinerariifolium]